MLIIRVEKSILFDLKYLDIKYRSLNVLPNETHLAREFSVTIMYIRNRMYLMWMSF